MKLTKNEFAVLSGYAEAESLPSQRALAAALDRSTGTINKTVARLNNAGLLSPAGVTKAGFLALEPYRAKRAVIMAAGFGSRLVPITLNTPKPLVRVNGVRIIDGLIDAILACGITEIYIVRGYLAEQFDTLLPKYPMLRFIENPHYNEANNISSMLAAAELLRDCYVVEADLLLRNPKLFTKYQYASNYIGVPTDKTDDWCFSLRDGVIASLNLGGENCYHMFGISYWNDADGAQLAQDIPAVYDMPGGHERYWDQVPLQYAIKNYRVGARECSFDDIIEIDTFRELKAIDPAYDV